MAWLRSVARIGGLLAAAALVVSFLGGLHPIGDSLAVFRPVLGVALVLAVLLSGRRWWAPGVILALLAQGPMLSARLERPDPPGRYVHYQKNLWASLATPQAVLADIAASGADTVALQELSHDNLRAVYDPLTTRFAAHAYCPFAGVGGVGLFSTWPAIGEPRCGAADGMVALQVAHPDGPLWLVSLHLHWPWPFDQAAQIAVVEERLSDLDGPILLSGDFNMVRWSHSFRTIAKAGRLEPVGAAPTSFFLMARPEIELAIDHILLPEGTRGVLERRPYLGSDHNGLVARWE